MSRLALLLIFTLCSLISHAEDEPLLTVAGTEVTAAEYANYLRQNTRGTLDEFITYRLKVEDARAIHLDTLTAFRQHSKALEGEVIRAYTARQSRHPSPQSQQPQQTDIPRQTLLLSVATQRLPQQARLRDERLALERMDTLLSVFRQRGGQFFFADGFEVHIAEPYPVAGLLKEFVAQIEKLSVGQISEPFISPFGVHIIKVESQPEQSDMPPLPTHFNPETLADSALRARLKEAHDGLLATFWDATHHPDQPTDQQMSTYFTLHRGDYRWDLPHYKGAVITCPDKKTASQIKKALKKHPVERWQEVEHAHPEWKAEIETGLYRIGDNPIIDHKAFKCGDGAPERPGKHTFIMGKKLDKGPDDYRDVREQVSRDYVESELSRQTKALREKYKVEINQDVLKTVNSYACK